jgi:molybdopterin synthase catalytic subunit
VRTWITTEPLDPAAVLAMVGAPNDGAVLLFLGTVRNQNEGRRVVGMRYDAYVAMAESVLAEIAAEAATRLGTDRIVVAHRIGTLRVGEVSVAIAVSSPHRAEAYEASRYVIEEIKKRLPVWKEEHYAEGDARWLEGQVPPVPEATGD